MRRTISITVQLGLMAWALTTLPNPELGGALGFFFLGIYQVVCALWATVRFPFLGIKTKKRLRNYWMGFAIWLVGTIVLGAFYTELVALWLFILPIPLAIYFFILEVAIPYDQPERRSSFLPNILDA